MVIFGLQTFPIELATGELPGTVYGFSKVDGLIRICLKNGSAIMFYDIPLLKDHFSCSWMVFHPITTLEPYVKQLRIMLLSLSYP